MIYLTIIEEARNALIRLSNQAILELMEQQKQIGTLQEQATRDSLDRLYNYRSFHDLLQKEWERTRQDMIPLTVAIADIIFPKNNDTYGHPAGDFVLVSRHPLPASEELGDLARHGGEEFGLVPAGIPLEMPWRWWAGSKIDRSPFPLNIEERKIPLTMSFGIAFLPPGSKVPKDDLIKMADSACTRPRKPDETRSAFGSPRTRRPGRSHENPNPAK